MAVNYCLLTLSCSHPDSNVLWCDWNGNGINDDQEGGLGDSDGDSYPDYMDSHAFNSSLWNDWNGNNINDDEEILESDSDGDGQSDSNDSDPENAALWCDWNRNYINDDEEGTGTDTDGDGHLDSDDSNPDNGNLWCDWNQNGVNDDEENQPQDSDGDSHPDNADTHPDDASLWNDNNYNGINDEDEVVTTDSDGDGYSDDSDSDPGDSTLWCDGNRNGINDDQETEIGDADGDGYRDDVDTHPTNASLWNDHNDDGVNDEDQTPPDSDNDGIPDNTDQYPNDFDNDGLPDDQETANNGDPGSPDTDGDGLLDGEEFYQTHTRLDSVDTDEDGLTDFEEVRAYHTSPLEPTQIQTASLGIDKNSDASRTASVAPAESGSGLNSKKWWSLLANPPSLLKVATAALSAAASAVTAAPTMSNNTRGVWKTALNLASTAQIATLTDTDHDGLPDAVEQLYAPLLNPNGAIGDRSDIDGDLDGDGISNYNAYYQGKSLNRKLSDFDGDGITDVAEDFANSKHPGVLNKYKFSDAWVDADADGISNLEEVNMLWGKTLRKLARTTDPGSAYSSYTGTGTWTWLGRTVARTFSYSVTDGQIRAWLEYVETKPANAFKVPSMAAALKAISAGSFNVTGQSSPLENFSRGIPKLPAGYILWLKTEGTQLQPAGGILPPGTVTISAPGVIPVGNTGPTLPPPTYTYWMPPHILPPYTNDADSDGMPNWWKGTYGLNPRDLTDAGPIDGFIDVQKASSTAEYQFLLTKDPDDDGLSNLREYVLRTNPKLGDSDGDHVRDGIEVFHNTSPLDMLLFSVGMDIFTHPRDFGVGGNGVDVIDNVTKDPNWPYKTAKLGYQVRRVKVWGFDSRYNVKSGYVEYLRPLVTNSAVAVNITVPNFGIGCTYLDPSLAAWEDPIEAKDIKLDSAFGTTVDAPGTINTSEQGAEICEIRLVNQGDEDSTKEKISQSLQFVEIRAVHSTTSNAVPPNVISAKPLNLDFTIPPGKRVSDPIRLHSPAVTLFPPSTANTMDEQRIYGVSLNSDLNNDGQITIEDQQLVGRAYDNRLTEDEKDQGTEFLFANDDLSNGAWDKYSDEGSDTVGQSSVNDTDDDAQELVIKPGITEGEVWLEHPAIAGLTFYKSRKCLATEKVNLSPSQHFTLSSSNPWHETLFVRADGSINFPTTDPQSEGDLKLMIKPTGSAAVVIEATKMKLTIVEKLGATKYHRASADYIRENNTTHFVRNIDLPARFFGTIPVTVTSMLEKNTELKGINAALHNLKGISAVMTSTNWKDMTAIINGTYFNGNTFDTNRFIEKHQGELYASGTWDTSCSVSITSINPGHGNYYLAYGGTGFFHHAAGDVPTTARDGTGGLYLAGATVGDDPFTSITRVELGTASPEKIIVLGACWPGFVTGTMAQYGPLDAYTKAVRKGATKEVVLLCDGGATVGMSVANPDGSAHNARQKATRHSTGLYPKVYLGFNAKKPRP